MKNILITGGTGFIGLNLIKELSYNYKVPCSNIFVLTRKKKFFVKDNEYKLFSKINYIQGDINNFKTNIKFNQIYHLAYDTSTKEEFLKYTSKTIINGIINIAKICENSDTKKLIFLSSSAVYENTKNKGFKEKDTLGFNLFNSEEHYGILKAASEQYLWSLFSKSKTQLFIYRIFAAIGPYMRLNGNFIIGNLIEKILKEKRIFFKTDCKVERNIIYIDDLIKQITDSSNKNSFVLKNVIGKNVNLRSFLIKLAKREDLKINFAQKKNTYRVNYTPYIKKDNYHDEYLYESFNKTVSWFKEIKYRKIVIK